MELDDLTEAMLKVLVATDLELVEQLLLDVCSTGWRFPLEAVYLVPSVSVRRKRKLEKEDYSFANVLPEKRFIDQEMITQINKII